MKKRLISLLLSFILLMAVLPGFMHFAAASNYLALGDSISTGYGLENSEDAFPSILSKDKGYELTNLAKNGYTMQDVLVQLKTKEADNAISKAQLITLTCGGNDIVRVLIKKVAFAYNQAQETPILENEVLSILSNPQDKRRMKLALCALSVITGKDGIPAFSQSPELLSALEIYENHLSDIISYIKNLNPEARIVVTTQYNPYGRLTGMLASLNSQCRESVTKLNGIIADNAGTLGYDVADVFTIFENSGANLSNADEASMNLDFHPNAAGHNEIAKCIGDLISTPDVFSIFADVHPEDWFYDAARYVYEHGIFAGVSKTEFAPGMPLTRGMFVTVLFRLGGTPPASKETSFTDVSADAFYHDAVLWATENGIVSGYSSEIFAPDDYITREQIASILLRYAEYKGTAPVGAWAIRLDYTDLLEVSDFAGGAVMYCTMKGLMQGKDGNRFAPKDNATRAESAVIMQKLAEIE